MYQNSAALYKDNPFPGKLIRYLDNRSKLYSKLFLRLSKKTLFGRQNATRLRNYYLKNLNRIPKLIIDIGCGTGETTHIVALAFPEAKVVGIDASQTSIEYAKKLNHYLNIDNVRFLKKSISINEKLSEANNADIIIMSGSLHHFTDPKKILKFLANKVQNDGFIEIGVYGRMFECEKNVKQILDEWSNFDTKDKLLAIIKDLGLERSKNVLKMKKENRFFKSIKSILSFDLSYFGYVLFPHKELSTNIDAYANPVVHYYNPNTLKDLINVTSYKRIEYILPKTTYDKNILYKKMTNYQRFLFCDAKSLISMYTVKIWL